MHVWKNNLSIPFSFYLKKIKNISKKTPKKCQLVSLPQPIRIQQRNPKNNPLPFAAAHSDSNSIHVITSMSSSSAASLAEDNSQLFESGSKNEYYERHVFLCYKKPDVWPSYIEATEFDRLPRLLSAALTSRKPHINKQVSVLFIMVFGYAF